MAEISGPGSFALLLRYLPRRFSELLKACDDSFLGSLEEIRLRLGQPLALGAGGCLCFLGKEGLCRDRADAVIVSEEDMREAWRLVTASSVYALEEELRRGYITLPGGHRVGIAGRAVLSDGKVRTQKEITSLNYRVARELCGAGEALFPLLQGESGFENTLIFSPPCAGKTTLLRDLTRLLSNGWGRFPPRNVVIVDERSELAATVLGKSRFDVGAFTDVLDGFPKGEGMLLAVRSLAPAVIVSDEIGSIADREAVAEAVRAGIRLLVSVHAGSLEELEHRPIVAELIAEGVFGRLVQLSRKHGPGTVDAVYRRGFCEGVAAYDQINALLADRDCRRSHRQRALP